MKSKVVVVVGLALGIVGCNPYPYGVIYNGTVTPHGLARVNEDGTNKTGSKAGTTCATSILGLVAWGDAGVAAAKAAGGIKEVHSLESKDFNVLYVYHQGCTEIHGE